MTALRVEIDVDNRDGAQLAIKALNAALTAAFSARSVSMSNDQLEQLKQRLETIEADQARQLTEQGAALRKAEQNLLEATVLARQVPELQRALDTVRLELQAARHEVLQRAVDIGRFEGEAEALRGQVKELTEALGAPRSAEKK